MHAEYLLVLAGCVVITLPLEFAFRTRVYRQPRRLLVALLPVAAVFYLWDAIAIARGHWSYSPSQTTGVLLPGRVPLEELVFFLVIPLCGLLTYESVGSVLRRLRRLRRSAEGSDRAVSRLSGRAGHPSKQRPIDVNEERRSM